MENTVEHEQPIETCGLCSQQDLRDHLRSPNHYKATLWISIHCILQFDVAIPGKGGVYLSTIIDAIVVSDTTIRIIGSNDNIRAALGPNGRTPVVRKSV